MTDTSTAIIEKLSKQEREEGKLPLLLEFYLKLTRLQSDVRKRLPRPSNLHDEAEIKNRFSRGLPLVTFKEFHFDLATARQAFTEVAGVYAGYPELFSEIPDRLKKKTAAGLFTREAARAWFEGGELPAALVGDTRPALAQSIVHNTLQPFLAGYAAAYRELLKKPLMELWRHGFCPVCGGQPDIAYLEKEVGQRWLVCSRCDTEWLFQRLECPFCGNQEQKSLSFFVDESEVYRLYVCDKCKGYIKAIDLRKTEAEMLMPLERLLTTEMDRQARDKGYGV